jgi:hypothetical protein
MPLNRLWSDVAKEQPDARVRETNQQMARGEKAHKLLGWMEPCFCVNCGKEKGMISRDWAAYVFALCDDCVKTCGPPPGAVVVPDAYVEGRA